MNFIQQLFSQLGNAFGSPAGSRRMLSLAVMLVSIGGIGFLASRARTGSFKTLYTGLERTEALKFAAELSRYDIPTQTTDGGTTLQVAGRKWEEALWIVEENGGVAGSAIIGYELMDRSGIGLSKLEQETRLHRSLEGELARTIMWIKSIESARVHLALPDNSIFVVDDKSPTASVTLRLRSRDALKAEQVRSIIHVVARSVEGLEPEGVSVIDNYGRLLNDEIKQGSDALATSFTSYKNTYESGLKDSIEAMIGRMVGVENVVARVNADFDFSQRTKTEETYDPDSQVVRIENYKVEGADSTDAQTWNGPGGSATNLPATGDTANSELGADSNVDKKLDRQTSYEISKVTSQVVEMAPTLERLTVSVMVDGIYDEVDDGEGNITREYAPRSAADILSIETAVRNIVGYSEERPGGLSDQISVSSVPFQIDNLEMDADLLKTPIWRTEIFREALQWGVVALITLVLIFSVLRPVVKSIAIIPAPLPAGLPGALGIEGGGELEDGVAALPIEKENLALTQAVEEAAQKDAVREVQEQKAQRRAHIKTEASEAAGKDAESAAGVLRQWIDANDRV